MSHSRAAMLNSFDPGTSERLSDAMRAIVERRARLLGPAYRLFYSDPVHCVRGEGVYLFDDDGRRYLDVYNNVPCVGHCHPKVVAAIADQAARLNTHTRYGAEPILDYAERLLGTFPTEVDKVMFTCSGSEAVDLALRVARAATGGSGVIVTDNAYHGTTACAAEISPSLGAGVPLGAHVRTVPPPASGAQFGEEITRAAADLRRHGFAPAALIVDTIFSTDGVLPDPAGFLAPAVEAIHAEGGVFIADEVQPGFGRTGTSMWGFQRHGVVPDLVVMGKPMGNGHPIAAMAARGEVLDPFARSARYFNTFGGNSVSIAAATAVLDVIEEEKLQENARRVGASLLTSLRALRDRDDRISDVRGAGLFLAVEFRNPDGSPDAVLAQSVVDGLRRRRILISTTGAAGNCLKIRPPLPFTEDHAEQFVAGLTSVLTDELG